MNSQFFTSFYVFIGLRLLDYVTTYLSMSKYGAWSDIEANPLPQYLIKTYGFNLFLSINFFISCICYVLIRRYKRAMVILKVFNVIQLLVVGNNLLIFLFI